MIQLPPWVRLPRGVRWSRTLGVAAAATLVLGGFALWAGTGLLGSMLTFGSSSDPSESLADALKRHDQLALADTRRFDGRSAFFMPPAPVRKPPKPTKPPEPPKPPPPPPPPSAPREYTGPKVTGAIGDLVFFSDSNPIKVGAERGGVKVLASSPPWSVRLAHAGGEYDVPLMTRYKEDMLYQDWKASKAPVAGIEVIGADKKDASASGASGSAPRPATPTPDAPLPAPTVVGLPAPGAEPADRPGPGMGPPGGRAPGATSGTLTGDPPVPAPLSAERIAGMSRGEAQAALQSVMQAKGSRIIDDATRERLNQETKLLTDRLKDVSKGQSGPR